MNFDEKDVQERYWEKKESLAQIAEAYGTYVNKIARFLTKDGKKLRDKSKAQKLAFKKGRANHPTEGKPRSEATKLLISEKTSQNWEDKTPEQKKEFSDAAKRRWENMDEDKKKELSQSANEAIRQTATEGSRLEKFLFVGLTKAGLHPTIHFEWVWNDSNTHIDIFIPLKGIAIEIDGPSHFFPIWGEDKFEKTVKFDNSKRGLLLDSGLKVIRVKQISKHISQKKERDTLKSLLEIVENKCSGVDNYFEVEL